MLVAADLQRPAAIEQLKVIGEQIGVPVYSEDPPRAARSQVCQQRRRPRPKQRGSDNVVILDTAGRLHVDDELMDELEQIDSKVEPHQVFFVCDAMTGQDAVNSAKAFNEALELDGVILTKLDGDTRGGAALSASRRSPACRSSSSASARSSTRSRSSTPSGMASRILGMGDIATLVEKAQREFDADEMARQQELMRKGKFTLEDFRDQIRQIKRMGPMKQIMGMIPGSGRHARLESRRRSWRSLFYQPPSCPRPNLHSIWSLPTATS